MNIFADIILSCASGQLLNTELVSNFMGVYEAIVAEIPNCPDVFERHAVLRLDLLEPAAQQRRVAAHAPHQ